MKFNKIVERRLACFKIFAEWRRSIATGKTLIDRLAVSCCQTPVSGEHVQLLQVVENLGSSPFRFYKRFEIKQLEGWGTWALMQVLDLQENRNRNPLIYMEGIYTFFETELKVGRENRGNEIWKKCRRVAYR